jgi:hypothetical protein
MTADYRSWPRPAREMATAVDAAVSAAQSSDAAAFTEAITELSCLDREQLAILLGTVTRDLLESSHPDGLDSGDVEQVLHSCSQSAASWYELLDSELLILALTGALGITVLDEPPQLDRTAVVAHGLLLIADQLRIRTRELRPVLDGALHEMLRAQTMELP